MADRHKKIPDAAVYDRSLGPDKCDQVTRQDNFKPQLKNCRVILERLEASEGQLPATVQLSTLKKRRRETREVDDMALNGISWSRHSVRSSCGDSEARSSSSDTSNQSSGTDMYEHEDWIGEEMTPGSAPSRVASCSSMGDNAAVTKTESARAESTAAEVKVYIQPVLPDPVWAYLGGQTLCTLVCPPKALPCAGEFSDMEAELILIQLENGRAENGAALLLETVCPRKRPPGSLIRYVLMDVLLSSRAYKSEAGTCLMSLPPLSKTELNQTRHALLAVLDIHPAETTNQIPFSANDLMVILTAASRQSSGNSCNGDSRWQEQRLLAAEVAVQYLERQLLIWSGACRPAEVTVAYGAQRWPKSDSCTALAVQQWLGLQGKGRSRMLDIVGLMAGAAERTDESASRVLWLLGHLMLMVLNTDDRPKDMVYFLGSRLCSYYKGLPLRASRRRFVESLPALVRQELCESLILQWCADNRKEVPMPGSVLGIHARLMWIANIHAYAAAVAGSTSFAHSSDECVQASSSDEVSRQDLSSLLLSLAGSSHQISEGQLDVPVKYRQFKLSGCLDGAAEGLALIDSARAAVASLADHLPSIQSVTDDLMGLGHLLQTYSLWASKALK